MIGAAKQLHPFQDRGADFVAARRHAYLADEMGLGKSGQLAVALERSGAKRALIVAPAIMESDWLETLLDFTPNRPPAHCLRDPAKIPRTGDVICSYNRAEMFREELRKMKWDALVCDEAKALKNPQSERTRAILNPIYGGAKSIAASAGAVWLADGTPILNNVGDLYSALRTAGLFHGRYWDFVYQHAEVAHKRKGRITERKIGKVKNVEALKGLLKGYMLARTTDEVLPELPPIDIGEIIVPGGEVNRADPILEILRRLDADAHDAIETAIAAGDWRMQHVPHLSTIRRLTGLAKAATVAAVIRLELECGRFEKGVLFGLHSDVLKYLQHDLADFNPVMLTGAESQAKRRDAIRAFQTDPRHRIAIGQNTAAGAGVTLTASNRLIIVEPDWTDANNKQIFKRVNRIGQHKRCRGSYAVLEGSSDVRVTKAFRAKAETTRQVITFELTG